MRRLLRFIALSAIVHAAVLLWVRRAAPIVPPHEPASVKIRIVEVPRRPPGPPIVAPAAASGSSEAAKPAAVAPVTPKHARAPGKKPASGAAAQRLAAPTPGAPPTGGAADRKNAVASTTPGGARYEDYLPGPGMALDGGAKGSGSGSDDAGAAAFAALTRHIAPLSHFARELAEHIALPDALSKVAASGRARARFSKSRGLVWSVARADGDPYLRAAIYEALTTLSPNSVALAYLEQTGLPSVRIAIDYWTTSPVDTRTPPLTVRVEGDVIFLTFVRRVQDAGWQTLVPLTPQQLGVDLIGAAAYLTEKATRGFEADADLKRLRLSPAFARPIN